ncbi:hypothetical protein ACHAWF_018229 [Thalassiosira exigua]
MNLLQRSERKWQRKALLSRRMTMGSDVKWGGTGRHGEMDGPRDPSSKENDAADGSTPRAAPSPRVGGMEPLASRTLPPSSSSGRRRLPSRERIYLDPDTVRAMKSELENLPFPAALATACLTLAESEAVLESHADADYSQLNDNGHAMRSFEIMGSYSFSALSLSAASPTQRRSQRQQKFKSACQSLIARGSTLMLSNWKEAKAELSEVFTFPRLDIDGSRRRRSTGANLIPSVVRVRRTPTKGTPKRGPRRSPKKARTGDGLSLTMPNFSAIAENTKRAVTVDAFRELIKRRMGASTYKQIFQQGEIISKPDEAADEAAARLDDRIKRKESERRSEARIEEILAEKERADKEREARESASRLMRTLTSEEKDVVKKAIYGIGPEGEILAKHDADSVQRGSLHTLQPGQWLNDEVINYFLKNCLAERDQRLCAKQPGRKRSHFFNSFFVQTMFDEKNLDRSKRGKYNYKNVRRWSKKVPGKDVFNLKYIVCPINLDNMHWTSAVIFVEEKRIQYYDSMGGTDRRKLEGLLRYLQDEHKAKKGTEMDVSEWELVGCAPDTPRQWNGFDCGVFTCMFCDFISKDCPLVFTQDHIDQCRERIALSIMKSCAVE